MRTAASLPVALALSVASPALAQPLPSIDARTWRPSSDPQANLVLEPTATPGPWVWSASAWVGYAQSPVLLRDAASGAISSRPVEHQATTDVVAGVGLGDRASVGVDVPAVVWQDGTSPLPATVVTGSVPSTALGDVALLAKAAVLEGDRRKPRAFGLALLGAVTLPTGDRAGFAGDGSATVAVRLLAEYRAGAGAVSASVGYLLRTEHSTWPDASVGGEVFGDEIPWSLGLVLRPRAIGAAIDPGDRQRWELAAHGWLPAGPVAPFGLGGRGASILSPALLAVDDRIALGHFGDVFVLFGADVGLDQSVGVPLLRGVAAIGWTPRSHDADDDGVPDDVDRCPDLPEDHDGIQDDDGCPDDDADGDGILDTDDACPLVPGIWRDDPRTNGCPDADDARGPPYNRRP